MAGVVAAAAVAETRVNRAAARDAHHVASEWIRRVRERRVTGEPAVMRFRKAWETSQRRPGRSGGGGLVVRVVRSALMSSGGAEQQSEGCERGQLQLVHCMRVSTVVDAATSARRRPAAPPAAAAINNIAGYGGTPCSPLCLCLY